MSAAGAGVGRLKGLPPGQGVKAFWSGTHRIVDPQETLDRFLPLAARAGVTRIADLTGLDRLRVPVAAAYRPNSRSLSVFQGKGATIAAAKASALLEAIETYCAESVRPILRLANVEEIGDLGQAVDVDALPRAVAAPLDRSRPILWSEATDLTTGSPVYVPFELVHADYTVDAAHGVGGFAATTNGLGAGNDWLEAVAHGLYEVVERDALTLWSLGRAADRRRRLVDPASVDCKNCLALLGAFEHAGVDVGIWDITTDIGVCAFACVAADRGGSAVDAELGAGCHPSRSVALMRALSEAAQSRVTWISGARDDFDPAHYRPWPRSQRNAVARGWLEGGPQRDFHDAPSCESASIREDLEQSAAMLAIAGFPAILVSDLSRPDIGAPVARVIVPGLEGVYKTEGYVVGPRGAAPPARGA